MTNWLRCLILLSVGLIITCHEFDNNLLEKAHNISPVAHIIPRTFNDSIIADTVIIVSIGDSLLLDGSLSTDPDSSTNTLSYQWTLFPQDLQSSMLSDTADDEISFRALHAGSYTVILRVNDGINWNDEPAVAVITVPDYPLPVAHATIAVKADTILLDASESIDSTGNPLTYIWTPSNSLKEDVHISDNPIWHIVTPECDTFTFILTIFNEINYSAPVQVGCRMSCTDSQFTAYAGNDADYFIMDTVILKGGFRGDNPQEKENLTYIWTPPYNYPSDILISDSGTIRLLPVKSGTFTFTLVVHNGDAISKPDQVTITIYGAQFIVSKDTDRFKGDSVFTKIQDAVSQANHNDTILVDKGLYKEDLLIDEKDSIFLFGIHHDSVTIDGQNLGPSLLVQNSTVITLKNIGFKGGKEIDPCGGIMCQGSKNIHIDYCRLFDNLSDGIRILPECDSIYITDCIIDQNKYNGIRAINCPLEINNTLFRDNAKGLQDNLDSKNGAIALEGGDYTVKVFGNIFLTGNRHQIRILGPLDASITDNHFISADTAIYLFETPGSHINIENNRFDTMKTTLFCDSNAHAEVIFKNDTVVATGTALSFGTNSLTTATIGNNVYTEMVERCIFCNDSSNVELIVADESQASPKTPFWCKGFLSVNATNVTFTLSEPSLGEKGIDFQNADSGQISQCTIKNCNTGILSTETSVIFSDNTIEDCDTGIVITGGGGLNQIGKPDNTFINVPDSIIIR
jgi:hypothetical protein